MESIWESLKEFSFTFRDWIIANQRNPLFWLGLFLLGLLITSLLYNALQKEK